MPLFVQQEEMLALIRTLSTMIMSTELVYLQIINLILCRKTKQKAFGLLAIAIAFAMAQMMLLLVAGKESSIIPILVPATVCTAVNCFCAAKQRRKSQNNR